MESDYQKGRTKINTWGSWDYNMGDLVTSHLIESDPSGSILSGSIGGSFSESHSGTADLSHLNLDTNRVRNGSLYDRGLDKRGMDFLLDQLIDLCSIFRGLKDLYILICMLSSGNLVLNGWIIIRQRIINTFQIEVVLFISCV